MWSNIYRYLLLVFLLHHKGQTQNIPFDTVISFGDSNTDTGNVYNLTSHTWPIVPPYFEGRFSDGPVWIEKLGVSRIKNYAYGGATTDNDFIQGYTASDTTLVPGIRQQIKIYKNETNIVDLNLTRTLYVIWASGNDYYFNQTISPSKVITSLLNSVTDLFHIGAKHILIINQSPTQVMPFVQSQENFHYYRERTIYHNNNLSVGINKLSYNNKAVKIYLFDIHSFILKFFSNHKNDSFNIKDNCWKVSNGNVTILCSNPSLYVYIDQYHFTTRMHEMIGVTIRQFLSNSSGIITSSYSINIILYAFFALAWPTYFYEKPSIFFI